MVDLLKSGLNVIVVQLLMMYEELEADEIRLFSLRKDLLVLSVSDYKEYEAVMCIGHLCVNHV
jgi:hypothetical protein